MRISMSLFEALLARGRRRQHESWYLPSESEDAKREAIEFISRTNQKIKIVSGEADPNLYEDDNLIKFCDRLLATGGAIELVFNCNVSTLPDAKNRFLSNNSKMVILKKKYGSALKLWWVPERPVQHYAVADDLHLFFEEPNHVPYGRRDVLFRYNDSKLASEWETNFDAYVKKKATEINFE